MAKQVFNPFLPLNTYIPDGEPHVFGDRVYLFGSQDKERGESFCMLDYEFWSAPVDDLTNWTSNGINYQAKQDPLYDAVKTPHMYAPDVVQGNDGRFYLYYCLSGFGGKGCYVNPISVAVCDTPDGRYEYLGQVKNKLGEPLMTYICFDPGLINDNGTIRLYYGASFEFDEHRRFGNNWIFNLVESKMFKRSIKQLKNTTGGVMGAFTVELEDDMLTAKSVPIRIVENLVKGTSFEGHGFFEASSMRKIGDTYYFIYSSRNNHELCYATSLYPDRDFVFRGTIVSNGDIGYKGRKAENRTNATGTNHGSIECINGQWYVFYHRLTHLSDFSRQACAEPIAILPDGSIPQVGISSSGLNGRSLQDEGQYPAVIACHVTSMKPMPHGSRKNKSNYPCVWSDDTDRYITNIEKGTRIGFKNFEFIGTEYNITVQTRGDAEGVFQISLDEAGDKVVGNIEIHPSEKWKYFKERVSLAIGFFPLFFIYSGSGKAELIDITLERIN